MAFGLNSSFSRSGSLSLEGYRGGVASAQAGNIFTGDPVVFTGGFIVKAAAGTGTAIFQGVNYVDGAGDARTSAYWPGGTVATDIDVLLFIPTADSVLEIEADGIVDQTDIGSNADFNLGTGNLRSGMSTATLNTASIGTGTAMRIIGLRNGPNVDGTYNEWGSATTRVLVRLNAAATIAVTPV